MAQLFHHARNLILAKVHPLEAERVDLFDAVDRCLAQEIIAPYDLPPWDNSAMDGYALRMEDARQGVVLPIIATLAAGADPAGVVVRPGTAVRILTGAPTPAGCELVIPYEETEELDNQRFRVLETPQCGAHIRYQGEDIRSGSQVLKVGVCLRPIEINLLAALGQSKVLVHRRPKVAILSTGDELVEPGTIPGPGQIVNSNGLALSAAVRQAGGLPILLGIARDNPQSLHEKLDLGLAADMLITSAGVSAGDCDYVRAVLAARGIEQLFWKVDVKPGRPTAFGLHGTTPVFSLPGNPVSALLTFEEFVRPALRRMQGDQQLFRPLRSATLSAPVRKKAGRTNLLRVLLHEEGGQLMATSAGDQNTGITSTLLRANGIAILPAEKDFFAAGERVEVHEI
jgi:molybdopterin molybdotransferase